MTSTPLAIPELLSSRLREAHARLTTRIGDGRYEALVAAVNAADQRPAFESLLASSDFFAEQAARQTEWLITALSNGALLNARDSTPDDWDQALAEDAPAANDEAETLAALRMFRQRQMLRILWRDHAQLTDIETTCADLSALADCTIRAALKFSTDALTPKYGEPVGAESRKVQSLLILGMGKLGGNELNFSSDIDLIFAYGERGVTEGGRQSIDNQAYFTRLGQMVIRLLDAVTQDGFVFRVDMRLRPYGDSGALVGSFNALELYYQQQGREWERYAMIKARPISGSCDDQTQLMKMLGAFVYRRYTDFSVIAALRDMKSMMRGEVARLGIDSDIKRGGGGIREIEFIAQSLQLIHGGRMVELRCRPLLESLSALSQATVLPVQDGTRLAAHYRLLRKAEHALQAVQDRQTQTLPTDALTQAQVAQLAGFPSWQALDIAVQQARQGVAALFNDLISEPSQELENGPTPAGRSFSALNAKALSDLGYRRAEQTWQAITGFLESSWVAALQGEGRRRLESFLPLLCEAAASAESPDDALERALPFVRAVCRRSAYLVLLQENPHALAHLVSLVAASVWVADKLATRPELVDELLHESTLYSAPSRDELKSLVRQQLLRIPEEDLEGQMGALSRIKDGVVLRVAASELTGTLPLMKVSDNLSFLAEVMIEQAIAVARAELVQRFGEPQHEQAGFAVMAYGKLGGLELSYGSDLDLVFVFDGASGETAGPKVIDNTRFYTRLAQRVVHVLSAQTLSGRLYEIDLRLRPDGDSGLVATTLQSLRRYQLESAWTWEHQALVRSRVVAGDPALREALESLRREVLGQAREQPTLAASVIDMRQKMRAEHGTAPGDGLRFNLKHDPGGVVDIEFAVQYLVLNHASAYPQLTAWSDVIRILESLQSCALISAEQSAVMSQAYLAYRGDTHALALEGAVAEAQASTYERLREQVKKVTSALLPGLQAG